MDSTNDPFKTGMEQFNAMLGMWKGGPIASGNGMVEVPMKRLQQFAADVQKTCGDACSGEMQAMMSGNDRLQRSFQGLLGSRQPQDVLAAQSEIWASLLDGVSMQTKRWSELMLKLQESSAAMARDIAESLRQQAHETASAPGLAEPDQSTAKSTRRQVHA